MKTLHTSNVKVLELQFSKSLHLSHILRDVISIILQIRFIQCTIVAKVNIRSSYS